MSGSVKQSGTGHSNCVNSSNFQKLSQDVLVYIVILHIITVSQNTSIGIVLWHLINCHIITVIVITEALNFAC